MRISPAAKRAPDGGLGGVMVTFARKGVVPFGAAGNFCKVKVLASSCNV